MPDGLDSGHPYRTRSRSRTDVDRQCRYCTAARTQQCYRCGCALCAYHALPEWQRCLTCEAEYLTYDGRRYAPPARRRYGIVSILSLMLWCARHPMALYGALEALFELQVGAPDRPPPRTRRERFMSEKKW